MMPTQGWLKGSLIIFFILTLLPITLGLSYSLLYSLGLAGALNEGLTFWHWRQVLLGREFWASLLLSAAIAFSAILIASGIALVLLFFFKDGRKEKDQVPILAYLPLTLPAMVVAFFFFQLLSGGGFFSRLLFKAGVISGIGGFPNIINDPLGIGILVAHVFMATPFFFILFYQTYRSERLPTYEALASTLGAGKRDIRRRVIVPMVLRRTYSTLLLYFVFVLSSYEVPLLLGSQNPPMISVLTIRKLQRFDLADIPQAYVISVLYALFVLVSVYSLLRLDQKKNGK